MAGTGTQCCSVAKCGKFSRVKGQYELKISALPLKGNFQLPSFHTFNIGEGKIKAKIAEKGNFETEKREKPVE